MGANDKKYVAIGGPFDVEEKNTMIVLPRRHLVELTVTISRTLGRDSSSFRLLTQKVLGLEQQKSFIP